MAKVNQTLKPDNTIITDLKKRRSDTKAELLVIDDKIAAKYARLEEFLAQKAEGEAQIRADIAALKEKKAFLTSLDVEDTILIGE